MSHSRRRDALLRILGTGACIAALVSAASAQRARPGPKKPNVILIVLDDLGTDQLAFYGETPVPTPTRARTASGQSVTGIPLLQTLPATPNLDKLRREGIWFTRAYGSPVCSATRAYIQTGKYGFRTGVGWITNSLNDPGDWELPSQEKFLPELLEQGFEEPAVGLPYRCGAFGKWHLTTTLAEDRGHAVENGFHRFYGTMGNVGGFFRYDWIEHDKGTAPVLIKVNGTQTHSTDTFLASVTRKAAVEWIQAQTHSFFAYVAFGPPHAPLMVPPYELLPDSTQRLLARFGLNPGDALTPFDQPDLVRLVYHSLVEAVDTEVGNLLAALPAATRKNTMIFVIGDNGTPGTAVMPPHDPLHAKGEVFELGIRVPLIVNGPMVKGPIPEGGWKSTALVSAVDLWRTIADVTGANAARVVPLHELDSISFMPVLRDPLSSGNRTTVFSQIFIPNGVLGLPPPSCYTQTNDRAMTDGVYKYFRLQTPLANQPCDIPSYVEALVHLPSDPEEENNLITSGLTPEAANALAFLRAEMDFLSGQ